VNRQPLAIAGLLLATTSLLGCAVSDPASAPTATATATATATPAAPTAVIRSAADALTALDAWLVCYGATYGVYSETSTLFPYTPEVVTENGDGTFEVRVPFAPTSGTGSGAESICVAEGTVGEPVVELRGGRDFG
jgi:hypothetical protein